MPDATNEADRNQNVAADASQSVDDQEKVVTETSEAATDATVVAVARAEEAIAEKKFRGSMRGRYGGIIAGLITATVIIGVYALSNEKFLPSIAPGDNTRAFLAFIFGFGTIIMVFLSVLFIVFADDEDYKERMDGIKYIFSILIAVLGTITGFYFGQSTTQPPGPAPAAVSVPAQMGQPSDAVSASDAGQSSGDEASGAGQPDAGTDASDSQNPADS